MLNGLSLFSGYGGIDLALSEWVRPVMYCEIEKFPQAMLISRMDDGSLPFAPIWDDVTTLDGNKLRGVVDFIYGGFPCQDISTAGNGEGLDGKRSGLFFEFIRLLSETKAPFAFFENVPAIETRGAERVQEALAQLGFTAKWLHLSASEIGANHKRERWFCLAHSERIGTQIQAKGKLSAIELSGSTCKNRKTSDSYLSRFGKYPSPPEKEDYKGIGKSDGWPVSPATNRDWWATQSEICGVDDGSTFRMDRIKALGNGVVPLQVKTAFEILMGITK